MKNPVAECVAGEFLHLSKGEDDIFTFLMGDLMCDLSGGWVEA